MVQQVITISWSLRDANKCYRRSKAILRLTILKIFIVKWNVTVGSVVTIAMILLNKSRQLLRKKLHEWCTARNNEADYNDVTFNCRNVSSDLNDCSKKSSEAAKLKELIKEALLLFAYFQRFAQSPVSGIYKMLLWQWKSHPLHFFTEILELIKGLLIVWNWITNVCY